MPIKNTPAAANLFRLNGAAPRDIAKRTWAEIRKIDVFGRAAQLAYYFFLALFPFLICVIASLSVFGSADRGRALLFQVFATVLPAPAFRLISDTFNEILRSSGPLKMSLGIIASLWSASMGMIANIDTSNAAYKVEETRSVVKQYALAIGLTLGIALALVGGVVLVLFGQSILRSTSTEPLVVMVWKLVRWPAGLVALLLIFAITYYVAPDLKDRRWHWVTPGALAGVSVLVIVSLGLRAYLYFSDSYSAAYGSLGAVFILLLCFYISGIAVLSGGVLNGVLERLNVPDKAASIIEPAENKTDISVAVNVPR
jgi:membrane protein